MENKMEFLKKDVVQKKRFINNESTGLISDKNQDSEEEQKRNIKSSFKIIKGKVKVYHENCKSRLIGSHDLDNESELIIVFERMLFFLKFTFVLCMFFFFFFHV